MTSIASSPPIDRALVRQLQPLLLAYARRRLAPADAEDVVQITWAAALRGHHDGRGSLQGYLFGILRRQVIDRRRTQRRHVPLAIEPTREPRMHERLEAREALREVETHWHHLAPREADALELLVLDERERDEVTETLGISRAHLRVLVHRGRAKLSRELLGAA